ncbi:unnamed protein product [Darwinula stevensoni]|uniref:Elongation of very long chain fatty acids protein n=1 Tax=Darwinula stevensoni TaxID=69355 RepID=A0A7R9A3I0_9CRUS|nr:unnamed protein product [Darwinula stevensoni]CAG0882178.1 unnamed protein product [Darwinula stevensoni]
MEFGGSGGLLHQIIERYKWVQTLADERVVDWPLMTSPLAALMITMGYFLIVVVGPKAMTHFKPLPVAKLLFPYNISVACLNLYIAVEGLHLVWLLKYNWVCEPVRYTIDPLEMRVAAVLWWYLISKLIEFCDTIFIIIRKKVEHLTPLHIYHHSTMFFLCWIGVRYVAGGSAVQCALVNSLVHVFMYIYYAIASLGHTWKQFLWWKRYITILQMVQFIMGVVMGTNALIRGCAFPVWMQYMLVLYAFSFLLLFCNFYRRAYIIQPKKEKGEDTQENAVIKFPGIDTINGLQPPQKRHRHPPRNQNASLHPIH